MALGIEVADGPYATAKAEFLREFSRRYVEAALEKTRGNVSAAARLACPNRSIFRRLMRSVGVETTRGRS